MLHDKELREGRKHIFSSMHICAYIDKHTCGSIYIYTHMYIHTDMFITKKKILMTTTDLIAVTGHVIVAGIYNYRLPLSIPYSHRLQRILQIVIVVYLLGLRVWAINRHIDWVVVFSWPESQSRAILRDARGGLWHLRYTLPFSARELQSNFLSVVRISLPANSNALLCLMIQKYEEAKVSRWKSSLNGIVVVSSGGSISRFGTEMRRPAEQMVTRTGSKDFAVGH